MVNQDIGIRLVGEDKASGPIKNVQSALSGLERSTGGASGAFGVLGQAAATAAGFIVAQIGTQAVSAVSTLTKEMIELTLETEKFKAQTANLLKNMGMASATKEVDAMISKMEEMTGIGGMDDAFNDMLMVTKDVTKAMEALNIAADISAAKNIDIATSTKLVTQAMNGDVSMLKRYGIYLDENAMKTMNAAQKYYYFRKTVETTMGGASEAFRSSAAGIFANFNNQLDNLKKAFGGGLVDALAPALEGIATKISSLLESGDLQPLIDAFGNLATNIMTATEKTWDLVKALNGATTDEEAIAQMTATFNLLASAIKWAADQVERLSNLINGINMGALNAGVNWANNPAKPNGLGPNDLINIGNNKANQEVGDNTEATRENTKTTESQTKTTYDYVKAILEAEKITFQSATTQSTFAATTQGTNAQVGILADAAANAASALGSISGSGGGGGGGGCPTYGCGRSGILNMPWSSLEAVQGVPGMDLPMSGAWWNAWGNQNANMVAAAGQGAGGFKTARVNPETGMIMGGTTNSGGQFDIKNGDATKVWERTMEEESRQRERNTELQSRQTVKVESSAVKLSEFSSAAAGAIATLSSIQASASSGGGGGGYSDSSRQTRWGPNNAWVGVRVNDALITKTGKIVKFNPNDNILAFQGNGPKGATNITINVNGAGDPERVAELILNKINTKVGMGW